MTQAIQQFVEDPRIKVEIELTDQAAQRLIVVGVVLSIVIASVAFILFKVKK